MRLLKLRRAPPMIVARFVKSWRALYIIGSRNSYNYCTRLLKLWRALRVIVARALPRIAACISYEYGVRCFFFFFGGAHFIMRHAFHNAARALESWCAGKRNQVKLFTTKKSVFLTKLLYTACLCALPRRTLRVYIIPTGFPC